MSTARHTYSKLAAILAAVLPLAACTVDVRDEESGGKAEVDIRTPVDTAWLMVLEYHRPDRLEN